jgi:hypothetical protein
MPKFFLHLRDGTDETLDPDGLECATMDSLRQTVLVNARGMIGDEVKRGGVIDLRFRIDAEDEGGKVRYSLPFRNAVNVIDG